MTNESGDVIGCLSPEGLFRHSIRRVRLTIATCEFIFIQNVMHFAFILNWKK